jgi:transcriptional regulator with XRE-family HTH domain
MSGEITFGSFIRQKRVNLEPYISLRKMAELLDISPVYMSNIENDRNPAPKDDILEHMSQLLKLDKQEREQMYELAAKSKTYTAVPGDLPEYISANEYARIALRVAKDVDATDKEWQEFIEKLKTRGRQEGKIE